MNVDVFGVVLMPFVGGEGGVVASAIYPNGRRDGPERLGVLIELPIDDKKSPDVQDLQKAEDDIGRATERLVSLGFEHLENPGTERREAFRSSSVLPSHHLYACP
ncbi:MAG: hypothetical protein MK538_12160 [Planctomycetes bacterium]|nr:hypothetical protein [Planctomycetota bacterium]